MQQPYNNYPYYGQPQYPQTPYIGQNPPPPPGNPYPSYYPAPNLHQPPSAPAHNNPPAPAPYSFDAAAYSLKPNATQSRRHRRTQTIPNPPAAGPAAPPAAPLRSAMKKTTTFLNAAETSIGRQFSYPFSNNQPHNSNPQVTMPRPRVHSNPTNPQQLRESLYEQDPRDLRDNPVSYHMLVSFHGYNELHIEHPMVKALDDIREFIWPIWKDGIESENILGDTCIVKFKNAPWDMGGPNVKQAYSLITSFFRLWQHRGYSFQTAVGIASASPRLIFQVTQPDTRAEFFLAYFSQDGRRFTLIEPPNHIDISIGARLRAVFPRKISDNVVEEYTRVIEVKRKPNSNVPEIESSVLFVEILGALNHLGFQLDATIPLQRRGSLGMRSPRELLVFKGHLPTQ